MGCLFPSVNSANFLSRAIVAKVAQIAFWVICSVSVFTIQQAA